MKKALGNPFRDDPAIWDTFTLISLEGPARIPGTVKVSVSTATDLDTAKIPGDNGVIDKWRGYQAAEISLTINVITEEEYDKLIAILEIYRPKSGLAPVAVEVVHPQLELHGIKQVYFVSVDSGAYSPREGFTVTATLREFIPRPTVKTVSPTKTAKTVNTTKPKTKTIAEKPNTRVATNGVVTSGYPEGKDWAPPSPVKPSTKAPAPTKRTP
jgi:hypothetical protein